MKKKTKPPQSNLTRRDFLVGLGGAGLLAAPLLRSVPSVDGAETGAATPKIKIAVFSKHLQWLDYAAMAEAAAEVGFDGFDLTVRPGGHVLPERVTEDLPKASEAVQKAGLEVLMLTTNITNAADPLTEPVLKTASELGIRFYRLGYYAYSDDVSIPERLTELKPQLQELARMNEKYRVHGAYQNHAGNNRVGAPLWDLWELVKDIDPRWLGIQFDIRHATVEGSTTWPVNFRLLASHVKTIVVKDFRWEKTDRGWRIQNCPLGQGMVDFKQYFALLKKVGFAGPISVHYEYPLGGAEHGSKALKLEERKILTAMRSDLNILKEWLTEAGLS